MELKIKLDDLGIKRKKSKDVKISKDKVKNIEFRNGIKLNSSYKKFIEEYDLGDVTKDIEFISNEPTPLTTTEGKDGLFGFIDEEDIEEYIETYEGRIPPNLIPIGDGYGGDLICIGLDDDKIYYWHHEGEYLDYLPQDKNQDVSMGYWGNVYEVSDTLEDFLNSMEAVPEDDTEYDGVVSTWYSDDVLESIERFKRDKGYYDET